MKFTAGGRYDPSELEHRRMAVGATQAELSRLTGVSQLDISDIEIAFRRGLAERFGELLCGSSSEAADVHKFFELAPQTPKGQRVSPLLRHIANGSSTDRVAKFARLCKAGGQADKLHNGLRRIEIMALLRLRRRKRVKPS